MIIHYTYINLTPIPIFYTKKDPRHIWVNMHMKGFLTEEIVYAHLCSLMDKTPPKGLVEAILDYPEGADGQDVTVVFKAGS